MLNAAPSPARVSMQQDNRIRALALLLVLGAVVRIGLIFLFEGQKPEIVDAQDYDGLAVRLVETGRYEDASGNLTSLRPPLYPYIVSRIYHTFGLENYTAVRIAQAILSLCTLLLVYQLGKELYDSNIGLLAAAAYGFYPSLLGMNNLILSEGLFIFFFVAAMLLTVRLLRQPTIWAALGIGVCLALGALTRSILWLFSPLFALLLFFAIQAPIGKRIVLAGTVLASFLVVIFPWAWRNTQVHKTLVVIDVMGGRNVMMGNYEYTPLERSWATISDVTGEKSWHIVLAANTPGYSGLTQGQIDKAAMKYGIKYFFNHPGISLKRSIVKFFNFWQLDRMFVAGLQRGIFGEMPKIAILGLAALICGSHALILFLAIYGLWMMPPANRWLHGLLLFGIAFTCLIHTAAFAHSRYQLPLIPILMVYAAAAAVNWKTLWEKRSTWTFTMATLCCILLVAGWVREFVMVDLKHFG